MIVFIILYWKNTDILFVYLFYISMLIFNIIAVKWKSPQCQQNSLMVHFNIIQLMLMLLYMPKKWSTFIFTEGESFNHHNYTIHHLNKLQSTVTPDLWPLTGHQDKLGVAETKLLHTLHWMLLDAAQECNHEPSLSHGWSGGSSSSAFLQSVGNQGSSTGAPGSCSGSALGGSGPQHSGSLLGEDEHARTKLFHKSMATVELFVFLFAPLIHRIKVCTWI